MEPTNSDPDKKTTGVHLENITARDIHIRGVNVFPAGRRPPSFPLHHLPHPRNPNFTGRHHLLRQLQSHPERALVITEQALGPDHPHTATIRQNLARLNQEHNSSQ